MQRTKLSALVLLVIVVGTAPPIRAHATPNGNRSTNVTLMTKSFLDAYAGGDVQSVLSIVARDVTVYGSDGAEVFRGRGGVQKMMEQDQLLWHNSAHIGAMQQVSIFSSRELVSIFFNAPFSVSQGPAVTVRFSIVWRRTGGKWLLVQASSVVPTQGQSAEELLRPNKSPESK